MNISFAEKKDNYARISLAVSPEDYQTKVDQQIKTLAQKANIPGFRKGHAPVGMIRKMYGESVKAEAINKVISEGLYDFMQAEKLRVLGQPIPTAESAQLDIMAQEAFTYSFEVALRPQITNLLTKEDKLNLYKIETTDEMVEKMLQESLKGAGKLQPQEEVSEEDFLRGSVHELDGDLPKADGITVEDATLLVKYIKNEEERNKFIGTPKNSVVVFEPYKAFEGSKAEVSSFLKIKPEEVEALQGQLFSFQINEIQRHVSAELGQEFYDSVFGKDVVKTEEEARKKIREYSEARTLPDTNMKLLDDLKDYVRNNKIADINIDAETLKRWYQTTEEGAKINEAEYEEIFGKLLESLKVQLYLDAMCEKYNITVTEEEIKTFAKEMTRAQFLQYGIPDINDEVMERLSADMLKKDNTRERIHASILDQKLATEVQKDITLEEKLVSPEEFTKLTTPATAEQPE